MLGSIAVLLLKGHVLAILFIGKQVIDIIEENCIVYFVDVSCTLQIIRKIQPSRSFILSKYP